jgi:hypothetical protein
METCLDDASCEMMMSVAYATDEPPSEEDVATGGAIAYNLMVCYQAACIPEYSGATTSSPAFTAEETNDDTMMGSCASPEAEQCVEECQECVFGMQSDDPACCSCAKCKEFLTCGGYIGTGHQEVHSSLTATIPTVVHEIYDMNGDIQDILKEMKQTIDELTAELLELLEDDSCCCDVSQPDDDEPEICYSAAEMAKAWRQGYVDHSSTGSHEDAMFYMGDKVMVKASGEVAIVVEVFDEYCTIDYYDGREVTSRTTVDCNTLAHRVDPPWEHGKATSTVPAIASTMKPTTTWECSPGCRPGWPGDSDCDEACNTESCFFDLGDCELPPSSYGYGYRFGYEYG